MYQLCWCWFPVPCGVTDIMTCIPLPFMERWMATLFIYWEWTTSASVWSMLMKCRGWKWKKKQYMWHSENAIFWKGLNLCPYIVQGWFQSGIKRPPILPWSMNAFLQLWSLKLLTVLMNWERFSLRIEFVAIHCSRMVVIRQQAINTIPVDGFNWTAMVTWVIDSTNQLVKVISK